MAELLANSPTPGQRLAVGELASALTAAATGAKALKLKAAFAKQTGLRAAGEARVIIDSEIIRITTVAAAETELEILERGAEESTAASHGIGSLVFCEPTVGSLNARYQTSGAALLTAKTPLKVTGQEVELEEGKLTNAFIKAAAGIEESKLSLPEVIVKTGIQSISGEKEFKIAKAERLLLYGTKEIAGLATLEFEGPGKFAILLKVVLQLGRISSALTQVKISGKIENGTQFAEEEDCVYQILPEGGAAEIASIKPGTQSPKHRVMIWVNVSTTETLTILHEGAGLAENRFFFASKKAVKLEPGQIIALWHVEGTPTEKYRWRDIGGSSFNFPAKQHAAITEPAAFVAGANGFDSEAHAKEIRDKLNEVIAVLKERGLTT